MNVFPVDRTSSDLRQDADGGSGPVDGSRDAPAIAEAGNDGGKDTLVDTDGGRDAPAIAEAGNDGGKDTLVDTSPANCGMAGKMCAGMMLTTCSANGVPTSVPCEHGCNAVRSDCNVCPPNSRRCSGSALVICNAEGTASQMMACAAGCNTTANECNGCVPSTRWCNGNILRECTAAGMQVDRQTCEQGCNTTRLECNSCQPGAKSCNGATLQACRPDGSGLADMTCPSGCNTARQACNVCSPGAKVCSGSTLQTCRTDGGGWVDTSCASGCNSTRLECNVCNPSAPPTCSGSSVRSCRADGSGTVDTSCANGCTSGRCNECAPGERICSGISLRTCRTDGTWSETRCPAPTNATATCQNGACGFACSRGVAACSGGDSCPVLTWDFESGRDRVSIEPKFTRSPTSNVRTTTFGGSAAFAVDLSSTPETDGVGVRFSFCAGQVANLRGKRVSLRYWVDGRPMSDDADAWIIFHTAGQGDLYSGTAMPLVNQWVQVDGQSLARAPGVDETLLGISLHIFGFTTSSSPTQSWTGTLYVDDLRIH